MKTKMTIAYYSNLKYVGETWQEVKNRIVNRRKRIALKGKSMVK